MYGLIVEYKKTLVFFKVRIKYIKKTCITSLNQA